MSPLRFQAGGALRPGSLYIERPADAELLAALQAGAFCYVLAPRQIGKSSLRVRTTARLRQAGVGVVGIDLTRLGADDPELRAESWYFGLVSRTADDLALPDPTAWWRAQAPKPPPQRLLDYLRRQVLPQRPGPLVIFIDEIDGVRALRFSTDDFFAALRSLFNDRAEEPELARLGVCLLGVAAPEDLISNPERTPFNVGQAIALRDFTSAEAQALQPGLAALGEAPAWQAAIYDWTSGHPYMTQRLCDALVREAALGRLPAAAPQAVVATQVEELFLRSGRTQDANLRYAENRLDRLGESAPLLHLYERLLSGERVPSQPRDPVQQGLRLCGLAAERPRPDGDALEVRNRVFATVYDAAWVRQKLARRLLAAPLRLWLDGGKSADYLLRGEALERARAWAEGRRDLDSTEGDFLRASVEAEAAAQVAESQAQAAAERERAAAAALEAATEREKAAAALAEAAAERERAAAAAVEAATERERAAAALAKVLVTAAQEQERAAQAESEAAAQRERAAQAAAETAQVRERAAVETARLQAQAAQAERERAAQAAAEQERTTQAYAETARLQTEAAQAAQAEALRRQQAARRLRLVVALLVLALVGAVGAAAGALHQKRQADQQSRQAQDNLARLHQEQGRQLFLAGHPAQAFPYLVRAYEEMGDRASAALRYLLSRVASEALLSRHVLRHEGPVYAASFSGDGTLVVTASDDKTARVWEARSGKLVARLEGHGASVLAASFSGDGSLVVTASEDKTARVWEARSGKLVARLEGHGASVLAASFSGDGSLVVTASDDGTARVWEARSGKLVARLEGHGARVWAASFSGDGSLVVTASEDKTARVWEARSGKLVARLEGHGASVLAASFSGDGSLVVTASEDKTARVWEARSGKLVARLEGHGARVWAASFSGDGSLVVTASSDKTARVWEARSGKLVARLEGHGARVFAASFSGDGSLVVTASEDQTARVWEARSGKLVARLEGHGARVFAASFSGDGSLVVTASEDQTARVWEARSGKLVARLEGHGARVFAASFSRDGSLVVTASEDQTARVWEARSGKLVARLEGHEASVFAASFSGDGSLVVTASADKTTRVWEARSGKLVARLEGHGDWVRAASFSGDGTLVVTASSDKTARVWEVRSGKLVARLEGHGDWVRAASFSGDGSLVVTASDDKTARVWEARSGKLVARLEGHGANVWAASFSGDGSLVVTASDDKTARVWETRSGKLVARLEGHGASVLAASFSGDGSLVVTASEDKSARVWEARSGKLVARLEGHGDRVFEASFSGDGTLVVTASEDKTARVWEARSGALLDSLALSLPRISILDILPQAIGLGPRGDSLVTLQDQAALVYNIGRAGWRREDAKQALRCRGPFRLDNEIYTQNPEDGTCVAPNLLAEAPIQEQERHAAALLGSSVRALQQDNQPLAEALAQRALESCRLLGNPACQARALYLLRVITPAAQAQRFREAYAQLELAAATTPGPTKETIAIELLQTAVLLYEQLHRPSAAQPLCEKALALLPAQQDIQANCAEILLASGQPTAYLQQVSTLLLNPNPQTQIPLLALAWIAARQLNDNTTARRHATELTQRYARLKADLTWRYPGTIYALRHSDAPAARVDPMADVLYLLEKPISKDNAAALQRLLQR